MSLVLDQFNSLTRQVPTDTDMIIWPETAIPVYADMFYDSFPELVSWMRERDLTLVTGLLENTFFGGGGSYSSMLFVKPTVIALYRKQHLVPFAETLPLPFDTAKQRLTGKSSKPISINDDQLGLSICWELMFTDNVMAMVQQGAGILINIANEAWTDSDIALARTLQAGRVRTLETGRPLLRSASTDHKQQASRSLS